MWAKSCAVIFYCKIKHGLFPSLCIGDNQGTVLEKSITYIFVTELGQKERDGTGRLQGL